MSTAFGGVGRLPTNEEVQKYIDNPTYENANKIRDNAIAEAKGLTATETGKVFVDDRKRGKITKESLKNLDAKNLAKYLPLSEKEVTDRIDKGIEIIDKPFDPKEKLSLGDEILSTLFMAKSDVDIKKIKTERAEYEEAKKKKEELTGKKY